MHRTKSLDEGAKQRSQILAVFARQQQHGAVRSPPIFLADFLGKDRMRNDFDFWHGAVQFEETARHVVPSRDEAQAAKALLPHPLCRLPRVAEGIVGAVAESCTASRPVPGITRNPQQLVQIDLLIDPRYEKLAPLPVAQQVHATLQAQA